MQKRKKPLPLAGVFYALLWQHVRPQPAKNAARYWRFGGSARGQGAFLPLPERQRESAAAQHLWPARGSGDYKHIRRGDGGARLAFSGQCGADAALWVTSPVAEGGQAQKMALTPRYLCAPPADFVVRPHAPSQSALPPWPPAPSRFPPAPQGCRCLARAC